MIHITISRVTIAIGIFMITASLFSCTKDSNESNPVLEIVSPVAGTIYTAGDTIRVSIHLPEQQQLDNLEINLTDSNNQPVLASSTVDDPNSNSDVQIDYILDDLSLEGGSYYLKVKAIRGNSYTNAFVSLQIIATEREFKYPLLIGKAGSNQYRALSYKGNWTEVYSRQGDYSGSAINSAKQLLYMAGASEAGIASYNLANGKTEWTIPPKLIPEGRWFEGVYFFDRQLHACYYEGYIKAFDNLGQTEYTTALSFPDSPIYCCRFGNYLAVALHDFRTETNSLALYFIPGGTLYRLYSPVIATSAMVEYDNRHLLIFGNIDGQAAIQLLDQNLGTVSYLKKLDSDSICKVSIMDQNNMIISGRQNIYWYRYNLNSMSVFAENIPNARIACETIGQVVYATSDSKMYRFSYPLGSLIDEVSVPDPVVDLHLVYNK